MALLMPWHAYAKEPCVDQCLPFQEELDWELNDNSMQGSMVSMLTWAVTFGFTAIILALVIPNSVGETTNNAPPPPTPPASPFSSTTL